MPAPPPGPGSLLPAGSPAQPGSSRRRAALGAAVLSLRTQAAADVPAGTGLGWLGAGTPSLQGVQLLSMNILGGGWPEVRKGRWVGEIKLKDNVDTEQMMLNGL